MGGITPDMETEIPYEKLVQIGSMEYTEDPQIMAAVSHMKESLLK